jgi:hypothetical protein
MQTRIRVSLFSEFSLIMRSRQHSSESRGFFKFFSGFHLFFSCFSSDVFFKIYCVSAAIRMLLRDDATAAAELDLKASTSRLALLKSWSAFRLRAIPGLCLPALLTPALVWSTR